MEIEAEDNKVAENVVEESTEIKLLIAKLFEYESE